LYSHSSTIAVSIVSISQHIKRAAAKDLSRLFTKNLGPC